MAVLDLYYSDAESEDAVAQAIVTRRFLDGWGVGPDLYAAAQWFYHLMERHPQLTRGLFTGTDFYNIIRQCSDGEEDESMWRAARLFRRDAECGCADAQYRLATCYDDRGPWKDFLEASRWYVEAAKNGHAGAQSKAGYFYFSSYDVKGNMRLGAYWFSCAAEQGQERGKTEVEGACIQYWLGQYHAFHLDGDPTPSPDPAEAVRWYEMAAEQGNKNAQYMLGLLKYAGNGVEKSEEEAKRFWEETRLYDPRAEEALKDCFGSDLRQQTMSNVFPNSPNGRFLTASGYYYGWGVPQDFVKAVEWYHRATDMRHQEAGLHLGLCHYYDLGVQGDYEKTFRLLLPVAERGLTSVQHIIGDCYLDGNGVEVNTIEAVRWYRIAADAGYAAAECSLGDCYSGGRGIERNKARALELWERAASKGYGLAFVKLGESYLHGAGVGQDRERGAWYYYRAAEMRFDKAMREIQLSYMQCNLGLCYYHGRCCERDFKEAVGWFGKASDQNHSDATAMLGVCYYYGRGVERDRVRALELLRREHNSTIARRMLGVCHLFGHGVNSSRREAIHWFELAARVGDTEAEWLLGGCLRIGDGIDLVSEQSNRLLTRSTELLMKAAGTGFVPARFSLACAQFMGRGVQQSQEAAVEKLTSLSDLGHPFAEYRLGMCYFSGFGVGEDKEEAFMLFRRAAMGGNIPALLKIGECLANGWGVERNEAEASGWFQKAGDRGCLAALLRIAELLG